MHFQNKQLGDSREITGHLQPQQWESLKISSRTTKYGSYTNAPNAAFVIPHTRLPYEFAMIMAAITDSRKDPRGSLPLYTHIPVPQMCENHSEKNKKRR